MSRPRPDLTAQRAALASRQAELRARIAERRSIDPKVAAQQARERRQRRRRLFMAIVVVVILLLLRWCSGEGAPVPEPPVPDTVEELAEPVEDAPTIPPPVSRPRSRGAVVRTDRPDFEPPRPSSLPWLVSFRMQVAARSRRLSGCLQGSLEPGRLKWTTTVDPSTGRVSDHTLEPMLEGIDPSREETACITAALSDPTYALDPATAPDTPQRVSLVLEF